MNEYVFGLVIYAVIWGFGSIGYFFYKRYQDLNKITPIYGNEKELLTRDGLNNKSTVKQNSDDDYNGVCLKPALRYKDFRN